VRSPVPSRCCTKTAIDRNACVATQNAGLAGVMDGEGGLVALKLTQSIVPLPRVSTCVSICVSICVCLSVCARELCRPDRSEPELVRDLPLPQLEDVRQLLTVCEQAHNVGLVRCQLHNVVTYGAAW
jgi:hypothetical protein